MLLLDRISGGGRKAIIVGLLAGTIVTSSQAFAQALDTAPAGQLAATDAGEASSADIIVTAQKRSERLVDVPVSVSVLSADQLASSGISNVADLAQAVPGFRLDAQGGFLQPTIRGVSSAVAGAGFSSPVAIYVDGFYYPNLIGSNFEMIDMESVQILKGPQGTLFGRNATGGAILLATKAPSLTGIEGSVMASYGKYNEMRGGLFVTGPITDKVGVSVSLYGRKMDGYSRNIVTGERLGDWDTWSGRFKLLFQPTEDTNITLSYARAEVDDPNVTMFSAYRGRSTGATIPGAVVGVGRGNIGSDHPSINLTKTQGGYLHVQHDFGDISFNSYTSYQKLKQPAYKTQFDLDGSSAPIMAAVNYSQISKTFTEEANIGGEIGRLNWVAGIFYMHDDSRQAPPVTLAFGGGAPVPAITGVLKTKVYAGFVDGTYGVTDKLFLTLGGRYEVTKLSGYFSVGSDFSVPTAGAKTSFKAFTPRAVARYEITPNTNIYTSFSMGQKAGVFNFPGGSTTPIDPEEITAYEVGFKASRPGFQFEAAAFYYDYKNLQVTSFEGPVSVVQNAAKARIFGAEAHAQGDITDNLRFDIGLIYLNGKLKEFEDAPLQVYDPVTGVTAVPTDASGNRMRRAPRFTGNIGLTYHQDMMGGKVELGGNLSYQSKIYFDEFEERGVVQKGYAMLNLRAAWTNAADNFTLAAYGKNVTDTKYITQYVPEPPAVLVGYGWPVTYGVEATFRF